MKKKSVQFRRTILATACVLAAGAASAQVSYPWGPSGTYNLSFGAASSQQLSLRDYILAITAPQENPESVSALIQAASAGGTFQGGSANGVTVGGNSIAAKATGSDNSSSADLALLRSGAEGQDGIGIATSQVRGNNSYPYGYGTQTEARVDGSHIGVDSYGMTPASVAIEGNAVSAAAVLNQSASIASGVVPAGYGASQAVASISSYSVEPSIGAAAQASTSNDGIIASTAGSVNVATYQSAQQAGVNAGSGASVRYTDVALQLGGGGTAEQGLSLKDNSISAGYAANSASNAVQATGGSTFATSAMVTNVQANGEGRYLPIPVGDEPLVPVTPGPLSFAAYGAEVPNATAQVESSRITADLGGYDEAGPTALAAALRLTGNSISATSTGNAAGARLADGTVQAGNSIVLDASTVGRSGYDSGYLGAGAQLHTDGSYSDASLYADLGLLNTQANSSTTLASRVYGSGVAANVDRLLSQAAVAISGNSLKADATGNLAGNLVDVKATDFGATVAAANVQSNDDTSISASQEESQVTVQGGGSGRKVTVGGSTTLANNTIAATAAGNIAATSVSVQATRLQSVDSESGSAMAIAQTWEGTYAGARGGVTASNLQSNTGSKQSIDASIYGGVVGADLTGSYYGETAGRPRLDSATIALTGNTIVAQATGNGAATGVSLAGTDGLVHAAVANAQSNDVRISATAMETGVFAQTGPAAGSTITVQGNAVGAAATANQASNTLSAQFANMDVSSSPYYYGDSIDGPGFYGNRAVQAIGSAQRNSADVTASNTSESGFATATVTGARGIIGSNVTVQGNQATATAAGNQVRNAIAIDAGSMGRQYGSGASIADISSTQDNYGSTQSVLAGYGQQLSIGAHVQGAMDSANVAVTGNTALATATANDASNKLAVTGGSLGQSSGYAMYGMPYSNATDFNLANQQSTDGPVQAQASDVRIAIERAGNRNDYVGGSTLAVNGNTIAAEARANSAVNAASLTGFTTLASSAAVSNSQYGESSVDARVDGAQLRIRSVDSSVESSQLAMKDNTVKSLAVGASATNSLDVQATALQGTAPVYYPDVVSVIAPLAMESTPAGYAVVNNQSQWGSVSARTEASVRMNLSGSGLEGGTATVSGNAISAVAQATSASNTLNLAGTTIGSIGGTVNNSQFTSADVSAEQASQPQAGGSFVVQAGGVYAAPLTVSNNSVLASAGQNEAFNSASASGATVAGQFSVLNSQQGQGSVSAHADTGLVGVSASAASGSSLAVTGNTVAAKAAFNTATNNLAVEASAANAAGGSVSNVQTTNSGNGTASVGSYEGRGTIVGVSQGLNGYSQGVALNGGTASVNGNAISADASGNTAANALSVAAPAATGYSYGPAWSVLNTQANAAALNATVTYGGLFLNGASLQGSSAAVTGNTVAATASGNTASNSLSLAGTQSGYGQGAAISNVQTNSASISAMVRGAMVGVGAGLAGGGSTVVTGNSISAQAVGNTAVNKLVAK
ncbi:hypothetical protein HHL11_29050 [Ramlibacter sp. G-1-2-2]|uniref:Uncharacterized protein n=1 Tax=Ramlibacter agri TaxID=2728837 RepID=A0A848HCI0_9BURK|nr:hypothetical protein [Ramlibacter agri]NML47832.1 hypothetical protein [Ramlibacter agri]